MEIALNRFLQAQEHDYAQAVAEIKAGRKRSHWMWYIFPQYKGLGHSETSKFYAIQSMDEAKAYLHHPVLGARLRAITHELLLLTENNAHKIFGSPDDLKLKSSMTLFALVDSSEAMPFKQVLHKYFDGQSDEKTISLTKQ